jgi:hypothetical protein
MLAHKLVRNSRDIVPLMSSSPFIFQKDRLYFCFIVSIIFQQIFSRTLQTELVIALIGNLNQYFYFFFSFYWASDDIFIITIELLV